jgi:outer membrane murein-binding lipoprotein Lpp
MKRNGRWVLKSLVISGLLLAGCSQPAELPSAEEAIQIEELESGLKALTLSARAAERLGVQTATVEDRGDQKVLPYAAVIYDGEGATWAYVASETLTFQRASIVVASITGDEAILTEGPDAGTAVVIVGAAELYGAETGVGGGH